MIIKSEKLHDSRPDISKAEVVMKFCLVLSAVVGAVLIALAMFAKGRILDVAATVIPLVGLQWFFYLMARAKRFPTRSED